MDHSNIVTTCLSFLLLLSYFFLASSKTSYVTHECIKHAKEHLLKGNTIGGVFFVPDDHVKKVLLGLIYLEKKYIKAAVYQLTDPDLLKALVEMHHQGVTIEIITDKSCLKSKYEKITDLKKQGIKVYVYEKHYSIMHSKYWVFGKSQLGNKSLLLHGSANPTKHGLTVNEEVVVVDDRQNVVRAFQEKFDRLKQKIVVMNLPKRGHVAQPNRYLRFLYDAGTMIRLRWLFK